MENKNQIYAILEVIKKDINDRPEKQGYIVAPIHIKDIKEVNGVKDYIVSTNYDKYGNKSSETRICNSSKLSRDPVKLKAIAEYMNIDRYVKMNYNKVQDVYNPFLFAHRLDTKQISRTHANAQRKYVLSKQAKIDKELGLPEVLFSKMPEKVVNNTDLTSISKICKAVIDYVHSKEDEDTDVHSK